MLDVRKASFLPMDRAVEETGMEHGGITPVGPPRRVAGAGPRRAARRAGRRHRQRRTPVQAAGAGPAARRPAGRRGGAGPRALTGPAGHESQEAGYGQGSTLDLWRLLVRQHPVPLPQRPRPGRMVRRHVGERRRPQPRRGRGRLAHARRIRRQHGLGPLDPRQRGRDRRPRARRHRPARGQQGTCRGPERSGRRCDAEDRPPGRCPRRDGVQPDPGQARVRAHRRTGRVGHGAGGRHARTTSPRPSASCSSCSGSCPP